MSTVTALTTAATDNPSPRLTFDINPPFTVFPDESPANFLIGGMIKYRTFNSLSAKAKQGKSSLARYMAVCVSKGLPFLGRETHKGEVLIISIEDGNSHIDSCLKALNWNPETDAPIRLVTSAYGTRAEKAACLRNALEDYPETSLIIIDTLPKFARIKDVNCYDEWLELFDPLRSILKDFPKVSVLFTVHSKKAATEDVFDQMHGSIAIRAEFESNLAIFNDGRKRFFVTETRIGKHIEPTELLAEMVEVDGADVVRNFSLGVTREHLEEEADTRNTRKTAKAYEDQIIDFLSNCPGESIVYKFLFDEVKGNKANLILALQRLIEQKVVIESGTKKSVQDPYSIRLDRNQLPTRDFIYKNHGEDGFKYEGGIQ